MTNKEGFVTSIAIYWTSGEWPGLAAAGSSELMTMPPLMDHRALPEAGSGTRPC